MQQNMNTDNTIKLEIRNATKADVTGIVKLSYIIYGKKNAFTEAMIAGQISFFPEGQFVALYNDEIVGHCATFKTTDKIALAPHTWNDITGLGFASRHNPHGDYLYGMEVCVSANYRGLRIGQRLYDARRKLCKEQRLKGIIFGGRMPQFKKRQKTYATPKAYLDAVMNKKIKDPVVNFHLRNNFEIVGILSNYLEEDLESGGYATHMLWKNPAVPAINPVSSKQLGRTQDSVRVASVQFQVRKVDSFKQFSEQMEYFIDVAADYRADFVTFPELITIPLLSIEKRRLSPEESIAKITEYTDEFVNFMQQAAVSYNINIIGGSHPTRIANGDIENHAYVFLRNGEVYAQPKIHPTPNERYWWNIKGGNYLKTIPTDCGDIGVLICYDSEFPELSRHLTDQGAKIIFVPFCTDERQGYLRVRYCSQARAIENQIYVVTAGVVGNLPDVENMDVHYAESAIFTPCDFPFARDGIAAIADTNTETIIFADLKMDQLTISRNSGTVQNLNDRRFDLYSVTWRG
ncbi:MAG: putative amidohydrolase/GNAT superfamily N-acetyltransferase [Alphaproteobacteria bacterium]|jgi:predicted amidohydrolase/GNAT superfamily N-acetyltransferase